MVFPAVVAVVGGCVLAVLLLLPFVVMSYRRRGELGFGQTVLAIGVLIYGLAIVTYTLLPLPHIDAAWCAAHEAMGHPQIHVFQFVDDIRREQGASGYLHNPAVQQFVFNIALFVPLGAVMRQVFRRSVITSVLAGFGVSLLVEVTQLTGNWFLFPCPYRLFDVDDLLANTLGAAAGVLFAPLLRPMLGRAPVAAPTEPRPVTTARRLLGMILDLLSVYLSGGLLGGVVNVILIYGYGTDGLGKTAGTLLATWVPMVLFLVLPSFGRFGATVGQRAVRLRRIRPDGRPAGARVVIALLTGSTGYFILMGVDTVSPVYGFLAFLILVLSAVFAWRPRSHPGLSGLVSGLRIVDARIPEQDLVRTR